ncbi:hypothetical protein [Nocardioides pakistanensis]
MLAPRPVGRRRGEHHGHDGFTCGFGSVAGCWAGEGVTFSFEVADQDGFSFRAVEVWPADQEPVRDREEGGPSSAYHSTLTLTFDRDDGDRS